MCNLALDSYATRLVVECPSPMPENAGNVSVAARLASECAEVLRLETGSGFCVLRKCCSGVPPGLTPADALTKPPPSVGFAACALARDATMQRRIAIATCSRRKLRFTSGALMRKFNHHAAMRVALRVYCRAT